MESRDCVVFFAVSEKPENMILDDDDNRYNPKKLTYDERKASLIQRVKALNSAIGGDDGDEDEDDE